MTYGFYPIFMVAGNCLNNTSAQGIQTIMARSHGIITVNCHSIQPCRYLICLRTHRPLPTRHQYPIWPENCVNPAEPISKAGEVINHKSIINFCKVNLIF